MPQIDQRGIGPCNHKWENGRCYYCGEWENQDDSPVMRLAKEINSKIKDTEDGFRSMVKEMEGKLKILAEKERSGL